MNPMRIKRILLYLFLLSAITLFLSYYFQPLKKGTGADTSITYQLVKDWPKLPDSIQLGNPVGIGIDSHQNIFVFHRAGRKWPLLGSMPSSAIASHTILLIDSKTGKLINSWGNHQFVMPHGLTVDKNDNVWVTDVGLHQVFKFTHEGKLLLKTGEAGVAGKDAAHFNRPTDVAVAPDGSFYVSDGYRNSRVVKFDAQGKYLFEWGSKGNDKGQFNIPHGITLDEKMNVYVADRENNRVQVFDSSGHFLHQWAGNFGNICSVNYDTSSRKILAADDISFLKLKHRGSDLFLFDTNGQVQTRFGRSGSYDGPTCWYHDVTIDHEGNIYAGDILGNKLHKFSKTNAHP
jgi:peptidylamidoglycolate lyase